MVDALLVVFGAGASYDSVGDTSSPISGYQPFYPGDKPPLANQLFENRPKFGELISTFSAMQPIVQRLRRSTQDKSTSLERELERLASEADVDPRRHEQLMAVRFYLKHAIRGCSDNWFGSAHGATNYASLVDEVEHWRRTGTERLVTYVTFNYDTLLERSAQTALKSTYESLDHYVNWNTAWIIKPHGSIDWSRAVKVNHSSPLSEHELIALAASLSPTPKYYKTNHTYVDGVGPLVPAIAIPFETKSDYECPEDHLEKMKLRIGMTTKMLVIGWRGAEAHFLKALREGFVQLRFGGPVTILVVAGDPNGAREIVTNMRDKGNVPGNYDSYPANGFSGFMASGGLDRFLNSPPVPAG